MTRTVKLKVPEVGESITEVAIGDWLKSEGDHVDKDEPVVELESEKATFEAPAPVAGILTKILKQAGEMADVGEFIAHIEPDAGGDADDPGDSVEAGSTGDDEEAAAGKAAPSPRKKSAQRSQKKAAADRSGKESAASSGRPDKAVETRVSSASLHRDGSAASDEGGIEDELDDDADASSDASDARASRSADDTETSDPDVEVVPMSALRRRIADRLVHAQQEAALLTTFNEVDMTAVKELRQQHQDAFQQRHGVKLGFMSFFVRAAAAALREIPQVNAEVSGRNIVYHRHCDIGIAIGGGKGLVVPVLRHAETMGLADIEKAIEDFARRARTSDLTPMELRGGTFTISNGGIYGSLLSTPIVNPPQSGVLGMHAIQDRPVVREGQIVIRPMMYVALTYDHRIVDGREGVTFLRLIKESVEDPARLLLDL